MIAGLLLAAGHGRRFGSDKLAATLNGKAVIRWSAESLADVVDRLYVIVPPGTDAAARALAPMDVVFVDNWARDEGMASSIRIGIAALPSDVDAVMIALADQPMIFDAVTRALLARWRAGGASAVAPVYRNGRGHPVLFGRECFPVLATLQGDVGARTVLDGLAERLALVNVDADLPLDVDTAQDLVTLEHRSSTV